MKVVMVPVGSLTPDPENARTHSARNIEVIAASLKKFGQRKPIVLAGNVVIAGNGTLEAAKSLGWDEIAATRVPSTWNYDMARAYALADNRSAELAEWDSDVLAGQLIELDAVGWEMDELGFERLEPPTEPGEAPSLSDEPKVECPMCGSKVAKGNLG